MVRSRLRQSFELLLRGGLLAVEVAVDGEHHEHDDRAAHRRHQSRLEALGSSERPARQPGGATRDSSRRQGTEEGEGGDHRRDTVADHHPLGSARGHGVVGTNPTQHCDEKDGQNEVDHGRSLSLQ